MSRRLGVGVFLCIVYICEKSALGNCTYVYVHGSDSENKAVYTQPDICIVFVSCQGLVPCSIVTDYYREEEYIERVRCRVSKGCDLHEAMTAGSYLCERANTSRCFLYSKADCDMIVHMCATNVNPYLRSEPIYEKRVSMRSQ